MKRFFGGAVVASACLGLLGACGEDKAPPPAPGLSGAAAGPSTDGDPRGGGDSTAGTGGTGGGGTSSGKGGGSSAPLCAKQNQGCSTYACCEGTTCVDSKHGGVEAGGKLCTTICEDDVDCPQQSFAKLRCLDGICSATGCDEGETTCKGDSLETCSDNEKTVATCASICAKTSKKYALSCGYDSTKGKTGCICSAEPPCTEGASKCVPGATPSSLTFIARCVNGVFVNDKYDCWSQCSIAKKTPSNTCAVKSGQATCTCESTGPTPGCKSNDDCPGDCSGSNPTCCTICGTKGYCEVACF